MPRNNAADGRPWKACSRCGFEYPIDDLTREKGYWVCTVLPCKDDLSYEQARQRLADRIESPREGVDKFQFFENEGDEV